MRIELDQHAVWVLVDVELPDLGVARDVDTEVQYATIRRHRPHGPSSLLMLTRRTSGRREHHEGRDTAAPPPIEAATHAHQRPTGKAQDLAAHPSTNDGMDAIDNLVAGSRRAQAIFDNSAERLAAAALPTTQDPDPTKPASPAPRTQNVDVAEQLTAMTVAVDMHHVTTAALRSAFSLYRESIDLIRPQRPSD